MKKFLAFMLVLTLVFIGVACGGEKTPEGGDGEIIKPTAVEIAAVAEEAKVGDTLTLKATVTPENASVKSVEWSSSDAAIASIDTKGAVTFLAPGTVTFTAKAKGDTSVSDSVTVKVVRPELTGIAVEGKNTVKVESNTNLTIVVTPAGADPAVTWSSDNEAVATVNEKGVVTGVAIGTATITATSTVKAELTATFVITVEEKAEGGAAPESIIITGQETATVGYTIQFKSTVYPANANQNVVWSSTDDKVLSIDENGIATAKKQGSARIRAVSAVDGDVKSDYIKVSVVEKVEYPAADLKGYKIVIMNASSALTDLDPFLDGYKMPDKSYKQQAWLAVEKDFNCDLSVEAYPDTAPWGDQRIKYIIDNAANGQSTADLCVISSNWLYQFAGADTNAAVDVTDYYTKYGNQQMEQALKEAGSYKNKVYVASTGISKTATYVDFGLYYDYKWVKDLGVADPAEMFNNGEWNYTGFKNWALQVQAKLGEGEYAIGGHPYYYWLGMTNAAGVKIADSTTVDVNIHSQRSIDASNLIYSISQARAIDPTYSWAENDGGFMSRTNVMSTGFLWFIRSANRWSEAIFGEDAEFGYVPFPYPDDMAKEDTRVSKSEISLLMYAAGREPGYPAGVTIEGIYQAVNTMYLNTIELQNADPTFDAEQTIFDSLSAKLDNPASIEAVQWFTAARVFYDPVYVGYTSNSDTPLNTPSINTMLKGNDYQAEFDAVYEQYKTKFQSIFA